MALGSFSLGFEEAIGGVVVIKDLMVGVGVGVDGLFKQAFLLGGEVVVELLLDLRQAQAGLFLAHGVALNEALSGAIVGDGFDEHGVLIILEEVAFAQLLSLIEEFAGDVVLGL